MTLQSRRIAVIAILVGILAASAVAAATSSRWLPLVSALGTRAESSEHGPGKCNHGTAAEPADAHAGEAPDAHAGEAVGVHAGEVADAHAGEAADAHAGEAADAHAGESADEHAGHAHAAPQYDHKHSDATALTLSKQAEQNIGLKLATVELKPFDRTISVPAVVIQRPGRSQIQVTALFTGMITQIDHFEGEAITPGMPLCNLQLTHEEIVDAQANFLKFAEELDVIRRDVDRLTGVAANGAIAGKTLLERQYEQHKLEGQLKAQRQRLLMHGLTAEQVDTILEKRELLPRMTISAPSDPDSTGGGTGHVWKLQKLLVEKGQHVKAGDPVCVLADHGELYIEGKAFEQDIGLISAAAGKNWKLSAVFDMGGTKSQRIGDLEILTLGNEIDPQSRAFLFTAALPNELARDVTNNGRRLIDWRYRPGQRARLLVPVERCSDRIVLPIEAVVQEGAMAYVFERNQDHFDRREVHVEYRDQDLAVIANDGSLKLGGQVAGSGAFLAQQTMKNNQTAKSKTGGAPDPHAGCTH